MPLVKRWQPQVDPAPMPSVSPVTQDWSGVAAVQRAALHSVDVLSAVVAEEEQKANDARVTQQQAEFDRAANDLLLDPTVDDATGKPKGYKLLAGEDAFSQRAAYAAKVTELQKQYREGLASDTQRELFDKRTTPQVTSYLGEISSHAGKAVDGAQKAAFKLGQEANLATALNFAGNPELRGAALEGLRRDAEKQAVREGLDPVAAARFADDQAAAGAAAVVQRLAKDNPTEARNFFDTVNATAKPDGTGGFGVYVAKAEEAVRTGTLKTRAQEATLQILAANNSAPVASVQAAQAIPDVELRDEVVQRVKGHLADVHTAEVLQDTPAEGRIGVAFKSGKIGSVTVLKNTDDYQALSDHGKDRALSAYSAYVRSLKAEGAQERMLQNQIDQLADAYFKSLPVTGVPGADRETLKISRDNPYFKDASEKAILLATGHQGDVKTAVAKDRGVGLQEFEKEARTIAEGMQWDLKTGGQGALFVDHMTVQWMKWKNDPANAGKPVPTDADAYQMFRKALRAGEQAVNKDRTMPAWLQSQPNMYAWEAQKSGVEFTTEGFSDQPGLSLLEARRRELGKAISGATGPTPNDTTKPILLNPDGSWSTEKTMTFEVDGKHVVLPTIVGGKEVSPDEAMKLFRAGKNAPVGSFDTAKEANDYAQKRHLEEQRLRSDEAAFLLDFKARFPNQPLPTQAEVKQFLPSWKAKKAGAK